MATPHKAPTTTAPALLHSKQLATPKEELRLKHYHDNLLTDHIYAKHRDDDTTKIDVPNYITVIESILTTANRIIETVHHGSEGRLVYSNDPLASGAVIEPPLCTLHRISSELSCKPTGIEKAHETTLKIFEILGNYVWEAKAALTFLAFATDYGDLWHLYHYSQADPLAKSLAIIKRVTTLKKHLDTHRYRQVLLNPKSLIQSCLQALKYMIEIRDFSKYDVNMPLSELPSALRQIPTFTYWVIHTIVASRIELSTYLAETENQPSPYLTDLSEKMDAILAELEEYLKAIREQHEEVDLFRWLVDHIEHFHTDIATVIPKLLSGKLETKPLICGSTLREVSVGECLSGKNVILIISDLEISEDDIKALHKVYEVLKTENKYEMVWIPIIPESYDERVHNDYNNLRSKMKWYSVQCPTKISGMRYIDEKWQLREDPLVVVLNPQSKVEYTNAIHLIRVWETEAIPFTYGRTKDLLKRNWPESTLVKFTHQPNLHNWMRHGKNIIFYGGKDPIWMERFEERVEILKSDPLVMDGGSFEIVRIGKDGNGEDDTAFMARFLTTQWAYFIVKSQIIGSGASETTEDILRLISYQSENDGWAVLTVGSAPVLVGRGVLILKLLEEFPKWKNSLRLKAFPDAFREYFNDLALKNHICDRVNLPGFSGWIPMSVNCPECPRFMETGISFKCCHGGPQHII